MTATKFKKLHIENWRQFALIDIDIHPRLTVLTGANGAGKTTLLGVLAQHFGWSRPLLSTPWRNKDGSITYISGALRYLKSFFLKREDSSAEIGHIQYKDLDVANLWVPTANQIQYNIEIRSQRTVSGLSIPSHRVISQYQQIGSIPTSGINAQQAFSNYNSEVRQRLQGGHGQYSPFFRMKEALISMATFGEGNKYVVGKPELLKVYLRFINVLQSILPESLGFETLEIRTPDVVLKTKTGEFLIDSVSGGVSALIDLAWQIHTFSQETKEFVVIIDEPENHLHPSMQRVLIPNLLSAFPNTQFIVATHSPFIVTAVRDSNVHVLVYDDSDADSDFKAFAPANSVRSIKLDQINKAGTANEILRNVLGLHSTMPLWASRELEDIVSKYRDGDFSGDKVASLFEDLRAIGLEESLPSAVDAITSHRGAAI